MALTNAQKLTLRTHIQANTTELAFGDGTAAINTVFAGESLNAGDAQLIAEHYNGTASPAFQIYRTAVPMSEIMLNGFDWTRVDNLSVGKARIWEWLTEAGGPGRNIDPSKANVRSGINAVWVGTQADLDVRAAVYAHCHRAATVVEKVLIVSGNGTAPNATGDGPAVPGFQGVLIGDEISDIKGLPA